MPNDDSARFETMLQSENETVAGLRECRKNWLMKWSTALCYFFTMRL